MRGVKSRLVDWSKLVEQCDRSWLLIYRGLLEMFVQQLHFSHFLNIMLDGATRNTLLLLQKRNSCKWVYSRTRELIPAMSHLFCQRYLSPSFLFQRLFTCSKWQGWYNSSSYEYPNRNQTNNEKIFLKIPSWTGLELRGQSYIRILASGRHKIKCLNGWLWFHQKSYSVNTFGYSVLKLWQIFS